MSDGGQLGTGLDVALDRVCVVMMSALGDAVHTLPVINAIKRHYPAARITWVLQHAPAELVAGHRSVDVIEKLELWRARYERSARWSPSNR